VSEPRLGKALKLPDTMPVRLEMANCPRCGRSMPYGSIACSHCGTRLTSATQSSTGTFSCVMCGKLMPLRGKLDRKTMCIECEQRHMQALAAERDREERSKALAVSQIIARHPELRVKVMHRLGLKEFSGRYHVDDHTYQEIYEWDACVTDAKNLELARRYEDAARKYEVIGMWKEAGQVRDKKSSRTVKHVMVNINDLIEKVRDGGLTIPYKCHSCGAKITIDSRSNPDGLKFCSYCGSAADLDSMLDIVKSALK